MFNYEIIGYFASFFVVISFVFKNTNQIRFFNLIGCVLFIFYALLKGNIWPILIPNLLLAITQIVQLMRSTNEKNL